VAQRVRWAGMVGVSEKIIMFLAEILSKIRFFFTS
jgi:hypothetical protein